MPKHCNGTQLLAICQFSSHNRHNYRGLSLAHIQLHYRMLAVWRLNHSLRNFDLKENGMLSLRRRKLENRNRRIEMDSLTCIILMVKSISI